MILTWFTKGEETGEEKNTISQITKNSNKKHSTTKQSLNCKLLAICQLLWAQLSCCYAFPQAAAVGLCEARRENSAGVQSDTMWLLLCGKTETNGEVVKILWLNNNK